MKQITFKDTKIEAEIADTSWKRTKGLSLRKKGKMLFKFPENVEAPIDMMLMRKNLYLYFINSEKEIIHVGKAEPWYKLPKKFFHRPDEDYRYLLETFESLDLEVGDRVSF